jgi:protein-disulfide isomerase
MARKKATEMESPEPMPVNEATDADDDVIVLRKSWVYAGGFGLLGLVAGAIIASLFMYLAVVQPLQTSLNDTRNLVGQIGAGGGGAIQPTDPPVRIDNVALGTLPPDGKSSAKIKVVEFSDFQCPFCKRFVDDTYAALKEKYGDQVVFYYRHFPLTSIHPEAQNGALAAECANAQGKFWAMHDQLFATQDAISLDNSRSLAEKLGLDMDKYDKCIQNQDGAVNIQKDVTDATQYGVSGTPTFFINGVRLVGAQPLANFVAIIDQELQK